MLFRALTHRWDDDADALRFDARWQRFASLRDRALRAAAWCRAEGLGPGDVLALQLPKSPAFVELHLGALAAGVVTLPLHPELPTADARRICDDAGAARFLGPEDGEPVAAALAGYAPAAPTERGPDDVAVLLYTSGTTGRPKGVPLTHANLLAGVEALHAAWGWRSDDVLLHALPLFHVHGLFVGLYGALYAGAATILLPRFDADEVVERLGEATVFMGVPTFYRRLLSRGPAGADLGRMRLFTSGSAPLPAADHVAFERAFGHRIVERYGMTEIGIVLSNPLDGERRAGTVGLPLPHAEARVVDAQGREVEPDVVGELLIRGPSVFAGYLGRPDATEAALEGGWMHTGDLARIAADGYITIVGRSKDLILSGGMNVYPGEVEAHLRELDGVDEAAVFAVPDDDLGERVAAAVVARSPVPGAGWSAALRAQLAPYKLPRRWLRVDDLPRNALGKVDKAALRRRYGVRVRSAGLTDLDGIVRRNLALCEQTEAFRLDPDVVTRGVRRVLAAEVDASYWLATIDDEVAGQLMLTREWSDWRDAWVWWIQSVYVEPAFRGRGVFDALYDHALTRARREGVAGVRLYVEERNARAQAAYRRVGMRTGHYRVFERPLGEAP